MAKLKKCFAIDYSGSTSWNSFYHSNVKRILDSKYEEGDEIIIWDSSSKYVSKEAYMRINQNQDGNGGTYPKCIFDSMFAKHNNVHYSQFILISDGQVYDSQVEELDRTIQKYINQFKCDYSEIYLLGSGANLSVACPFGRFNASKTIVRVPNKDERVIFVSDEDLKTIEEIDSINTLQEFEAKFDSLEKALIARLLGTSGDQELRKSVIKMQSRINANYVKETKKDKIEKIDILLMKDKNFEKAMEEAVNCFSCVLGRDFQSKINLIIRMCDGGLKQVFDVDQLQTFRQYTASDTATNEVEDIKKLDVVSSVKCSDWQCPISLDNEDDPMILLTTEGNNDTFQPILIGFDKITTERIIDCPLNALYNEEFMTKFKSHLDHTISLKNYRMSLTSSSPITRSPFTRKKIIGAIPLGENTEHVKAANWNLMKLITGGKNLGDRNLWFFLIYRMIQKGLLPYLKDIEPYVKAQAIYRFTHYKTSISLSGLSNLPQTRVLYPTAAWTCLISPFLIPKISSKMNLFYVHQFHYKDLIQLIHLFDLKLPKQFPPFVSRVDILSRLLTFFKKNTKLLEFYKNGLQNASISINVDENSEMKSGGICGHLFLPIDGEINDESRLECLKTLSTFSYKSVTNGNITLNDVAWLMDLIDVQKNITDIDVEVLIKGKEGLDSAKINNFWKVWDDNIDKFASIKISKNTCRPFYYVKPNVTWKDELSEYVDISKPIISFDKYFGNFVVNYKKYPTKDEYILFVYRKICLGNRISRTLPRNISTFADQVLNRYKEVMDSNTPSQFIKKFQDNASIEIRTANEY